MISPKLFFFVTEDWYFCSHRLTLAIAAKEAGFDVAVITRVRDDGDKIRDAGIRLISFESERRSLNPLSLINTISRLKSLYEDERPEIVHHVALKPVVLGAIAARLAGIKCVVSALAGLGWLYSSNSKSAAWLSFLLRRALPRLLSRGHIIVQNPDDRVWLLDSGLSNESIYMIRGSGVDVNQFHPHPIPEGIPVIVLVARMLWDKGVGEFVNSARQIRKSGDIARFVLVGAPDPSNPASIPESKLREWAEEGIVEWWGKRSDMIEVLKQAHIACLPSYYGEGVPKSLLEAAAAGLPIVTTDAPGCREVVLNGENGLLVSPRNTNALVDALNQLIHNPDHRAVMGRRSRELAVSEFSVERVVSETLALYREILA